MELHPAEPIACYVEVLLPLALARPYTYGVPESLAHLVQVGVRVEVQFGKKKHYTGLVTAVAGQGPAGYDAKPIIGVSDEHPIVYPAQLKFWEWLSQYYGCSLGEVMNAALPAHFRLVSDTLLALGPAYTEDLADLDDKEYLVAEALSIQPTLSVKQVQDILQQRSVWPVLKRLLARGILAVEEDLKEKYRPRTVACLRLCPPFAERPTELKEAFERLRKSERQTEALLAFIQLSMQFPHVRREDLYKTIKTDSTVLNALFRKGILEPYELEVSRLGDYGEGEETLSALSEAQEKALGEIMECFASKEVVLLHGVTGSGKTRIYVELIHQAIQRGEQVLYLLPEIALSAQVVGRLRRIFGNQVAVYHSRLSNNERVEVWQKTLQGQPLLLGARSALFLPFQNLKWVIVDEEHDPSYKQHEPNPRYQGRDTAIFLGHLAGAKILLGTATPSVETYYNVKTKKYGVVTLSERFGGAQMPEMRVVDLKQAIREQRMYSHFSGELLDALRETLARGEQAILFQNRRGFSPVYRCDECAWYAACAHCDVSLTYHKSSQQLRCHYCNYRAPLVPTCPSCGSSKLSLQGFGTEKIEDELKIYLPEASIVRMDYDTVKGRHAHAQIIQDFEEGRVQVLVGTQMVTKGLDFERVGLVGILSADQLLQFPDFRSAERAFQLMIQVGGRAGRKLRPGRVLIQTYNSAHPVLREVLAHDFTGFFKRELQERQHFHYPPYHRLIRIELRHVKPEKVNQAAMALADRLAPSLGERLCGPSMPGVGRVRGQFILEFLIKIERSAIGVARTKAFLRESIEQVQGIEGLSGLRVTLDVDPS